MYKTTQMSRENKQLPWEDLYKAYQLMARLVQEDDRYAKRDDGSFDNLRLCR